MDHADTLRGTYPKCGAFLDDGGQLREANVDCKVPGLPAERTEGHPQALLTASPGGALAMSGQSHGRGSSGESGRHLTARQNHFVC